MIAVRSRVDEAHALLAGVPDPEVPVLSLVDLGVVRGVDESEDGALVVTLTPTYSGCPATEVIEQSVREALSPLGAVRIERRLAPAWTTDWISDEGRRKLREYGIAPPGPAGAEVPVRIVRPVACPRCESRRTERLSAFGATACKSLWRCLECREPFEHFKPL